MSKKGKFLKAIENVFIEENALVLPFGIIESKLGCNRCALTGTLSSNKKIFQRVSKNVWRYIKDELATLDSICNEVGLQPTDMEQFISDGGTLQYSYVRIKQIDGKYSKRQFYYMIHVLKKNEQVALDPNYLLLADSPQLLND